MSIFKSEIIPFKPYGTTKHEDFIAELKKLDDEYRKYESENKVELPESLNLTEKELDATTDAQIAEQVNQKYNAEHDGEVDRLKAETKEKTDAVELRKTQANTAGEQALLDIDRSYDAVREDAEDNALRRGLATSSIYQGELGAIDDAEVNAVKASIADTEREITALDLEIELLNERLQRDLDSFEIAHAVKVSKEIDKLVAQRDKQNDAVIAYNNTLRQKEAEYQKQRYEEIKKQEEAREAQERYELENGYTGYKKENYLARYDAALKYYKSMSKDRALEELRSDTLAQQYLGYYYKKLINDLTFAKG